MSDVLYDEWDKAYEEGREAGRKEAWSGDYDYRKLMEESRERAIRDAIVKVEAWIDDGCYSPAGLLDDLHDLIP